MSKYTKLYFSEKVYHEIQPFRFPIYKDLVAGEAEGVEEVARKQATNTYGLLKIAKSLANKKNIPVKEALDLLGSTDAAENDEHVYEYIEELSAIQTESTNVAEQKILMVTLFMRYRGEVKEKNKWVQLPDWTLEDTREMPSRILEQIFEFISWERNGWPEDAKAETEGNG
tara:strand:- start:1547 stop:2059 length:513 start_codon:yes stop_codon:yes gene_type:complete